MLIQTINFFSSDENGVLFNKEKNYLIQYPSGNEMKEYSIPETVREIGEFSFHTVEKLERIIISHRVFEIGFWSFVSCSSLTHVIYKGKEEPDCENPVFVDSPVEKVFVYESYKDESFCGVPIEKISYYNSNNIEENETEETYTCSRNDKCSLNTN